MNTEDVVRKVVFDFVDNDVLFTAVDVTNEVTKTLPLVHHREVRDIVRGLFSEIQAYDYSRTEIDVTVNDGAAKALLYHPMFVSFDLDKRYDTQKRSQTTKASPTSVPVTTPAPAQPTPKQLWDKFFDKSLAFFKDMF